MAEHSTSVIIKAPVQQVYALFTHFHDFPKFMSFVKEVTYYDEQRSHWVVQVGRDYEWDAVNEDWIPDKQIGWRSINGLQNSGKVKFRVLSPQRTGVDVYIHYTPPLGTPGKIGATLGAGAYLDSILKQELEHFARMVEEAPAGALDPMSSHYLFHKDSAISKGRITSRQKAAMEHDPMMQPQARAERQARIERETELRRQREEELAETLKRQSEHKRLTQQQQLLQEQEAARRRQEQLARAESQRSMDAIPLDPRHAYASWAHTLGDKDGLRARFPNFTQDPMTSRRPSQKLPPQPAPTESAPVE